MQIVTKFMHGAWIVVLIIPLIIMLLKWIHRHYEQFTAEIAYTGHAPLMFMHHTVLVPISGITKPVAGALVYATTISEDVRAVFVEVDPSATERLVTAMELVGYRRRSPIVIPSPYRSVLKPLTRVREWACWTRRIRTWSPLLWSLRLLPRRWSEYLLHNRTSWFIRTAFLFRPNVVVTAVPYALGRTARIMDLLGYDAHLDEAPVPPRSLTTTERPSQPIGTPVHPRGRNRASSQLIPNSSPSEATTVTMTRPPAFRTALTSTPSPSAAIAAMVSTVAAERVIAIAPSGMPPSDRTIASRKKPTMNQGTSPSRTDRPRRRAAADTAEGRGRGQQGRA